MVEDSNKGLGSKQRSVTDALDDKTMEETKCLIRESRLKLCHDRFHVCLQNNNEYYYDLISHHTVWVST
jgi:hypothetical protein